jgi:hypothetical protein
VADEKIEKMRNRAYQIWENKGRPHGRDLEHWLEAEGELEAADDRNRRAIKEEAGLEAARTYIETFKSSVGTRMSLPELRKRSTPSRAPKIQN